MARRCSAVTGKEKFCERYLFIRVSIVKRKIFSLSTFEQTLTFSSKKYAK